ncbi:hypothetical protein RHSIM_Rhsim08G0020500 [Rhododendron simsii]|uniref:Uncharacterized protein n=1 Tax=Rhododendron simsii TaxID=118357 RepID=A0A834GIN2_RHOSS|nr:hypothetical protein RHSIM_Rhsim08G0020500 [Rhododendron simsii]
MISPDMSRSKVFRLPQFSKNLHQSYNGFRCSLEAPGLIHNFVGTNGARNGWGFGSEYQGFMTRCEIRTGSLSRCGQFLAPRTPCLDKPRQYATHSSREQKSNKMLIYLTGWFLRWWGVVMLPFLCTEDSAKLLAMGVLKKRLLGMLKMEQSPPGRLCVQFNADVADGMPWKFIPTQREVRVRPGESALAFYTAENRSSTPITGVSTYNVTPMKAAVYFNKIQCFCFEEQRLLPGEQIDMPVFFYIDPEFETDPKMDGINNLILSYTFFKVSEE